MPGLTIEVPELIVGRIFLSQYPQSITILLLEHHCVGCHQGLLLGGVEELIQRPSHILFVLGQRSFILSTPRSKSSRIHVGQVQTEIASDSLFRHPMFLSHRAYLSGTHPIISYKGQDRSNYCVPLVHDLPLIGIQIIHAHHDNPCDLRQFITGTLGAGFQNHHLDPYGHGPLDAVDHQNPVTLYLQHSDDAVARPEQIILLHQ